MNILWILDKEFDVSLNVSARLATLFYLEKEHVVTVVTSFREEKKYSFGQKSKIVYLDTLNMPFLKTMSLYRSHLKYINDNADLKEFDLIFINSNNFLLHKKLYRNKKHHNYKLVADIRSLPVEVNFIKKKISHMLFKKALKYAARYFDGITYITDEIRNYCRIKYGLCNHKYAVWSSGVDTRFFKPQSHEGPNDPFRMIYHGKVAKNRGIHNIIKALVGLEGYNIEFNLLGSGKETHKLIDMAKKLNVEDYVNFHELVPHREVPYFINKSDIGILPFPDLPGWNTSSPIKLFEYLACGKPVIVTRIPAHLSVLKEKRFAFWAENSSPERLREAILRSYENRHLFCHMGEEARKYVVHSFDWEVQLLKLRKFLVGL